MVTENTETQPQSGDAGWEPPESGAETPQSGTALADGAGDGAGQGVTEAGDQGGRPQPRTYTQEEWSARESAKDKESAGLRQMATRFALDLQAERAQAAENQHRAADARAVDNGDITEDEAAQRGRQRVADAQVAAERQTGLQGYQRLMAHGEQVGRLTAAEDFAREFGVDAKELLEDKALTTPDSMRLKARELALEKREAAFKERETGPESFDGGGGGGIGAGMGGVIANMDPEEKIRWALDHPPKTR